MVLNFKWENWLIGRKVTVVQEESRHHRTKPSNPSLLG